MRELDWAASPMRKDRQMGMPGDHTSGLLVAAPWQEPGARKGRRREKERGKGGGSGHGLSLKGQSRPLQLYY